MKYVVTILLAFFHVAGGFGQPTREQKFLSVLKTVVSALANRDSTTLSNFIDRETGVYILYRIGIVDTYKHLPTIGFSDSSYPNFPFYDKVKITPVSYSKLPTYDCERWTETGTFVDTTKIDHLLSEIAKGLNREKAGTVSTDQIKTFYLLENKSRRIVIADNDGNELILYLSFIKSSWVLTIIDKVTCDCSV